MWLIAGFILVVIVAGLFYFYRTQTAWVKSPPYKRVSTATPRTLVVVYSRTGNTRYNERSNVERINGRLKDEFGGKMVRVRRNAKVMAHLMFGIIALTSDQLMRFVT